MKRAPFGMALLFAVSFCAALWGILFLALGALFQLDTVVALASKAMIAGGGIASAILWRYSG